MNALAYIRVSTEDQHRSGLGEAAQAAAIRAYVASHGWNLVETHREEAASAKSMDRRPELKRALERLEDKSQNGSRPQVLIVAKMDRLVRSLPDFAMLTDRAKRNDWRIVVIDMDFDMTTPVGELMAGVAALFAQFERRMISERTKAALAAARERGIHTGRPLATNGKDPLAKARIERALPEMRRLRASGLSLRKTATVLNELGLHGPQGGQWHGRAVQMAERRYGTAQE